MLLIYLGGQLPSSTAWMGRAAEGGISPDLVKYFSVYVDLALKVLINLSGLGIESLSIFF